MLGILAEKGIVKAALKPEWKIPFRVYYIGGGGRPRLLAEWKENAGWTIVGTVLQDLLPDLPPEELYNLASR